MYIKCNELSARHSQWEWGKAAVLPLSLLLNLPVAADVVGSGSAWREQLVSSSTHLGLPATNYGPQMLAERSQLSPTSGPLPGNCAGD